MVLRLNNSLPRKKISHSKIDEFVVLVYNQYPIDCCTKFFYDEMHTLCDYEILFLINRQKSVDGLI